MSTVDLNLFTDGSCSATSRYGSYGFIALIGKDELIKEYSEPHSDTTISRMELSAVIAASQYATELQKQIPDMKFNVNIFCDSQYVCNSINLKWLWKWESEGMHLRTNSEILSLLLHVWDKKHTLNWIRGHQPEAQLQGEKAWHAKWNNHVDAICTVAYKKISSEYKKILV